LNRMCFLGIIYTMMNTREVDEVEYTNAYLEAMGPYIVKADQLTKEMFFALAPLYREEYGRWQDVTVSLFSSLHSTSESIFILLLENAVFEADILLRTLMEGTAKFCYLIKGTEEEREEKYIEYKIKLGEIDRLTDHQRALEAIAILEQYSTNNTLPFRSQVLSEEEASELQQKYPAKIRNEIKQRWNYQNLLRALAANNDMYRAQLGSLSTYALTSHLCHYDWTGVSMRLNQVKYSGRPDQVQFDIGHARRILSNALSMYIFRVIEYMQGNKCVNTSVLEKCEEAFRQAKLLDDMNNSMLVKAEQSSK